MKKTSQKPINFETLSFFREVIKDLSSAKTIKEIMQEVMSKIGTVFSPRNWSLILQDRKSGKLYFKLVIGENAKKLQGMSIPEQNSIAGWIFRENQPLIVEDVEKDVRFNRDFDKISGLKTKSIVGVPLAVDDKVIGVIELINAIDQMPFKTVDLEVLSTIADFTAIAIERAYYNQRLKEMAAVDPLTGLFNRRSFEEFMIKETERCKRYGGTISLLMIDVDDFKTLNDRFGHLCGDNVLKDLAQIIKNCARKADVVARYGGDEFVIIMPHTQRAGAQHLQKRICQAIEHRNNLPSVRPFRISVGIHCANRGTIEDLLRQSDIDLYKQKSDKKNVDFIEEQLCSMEG